MSKMPSINTDIRDAMISLAAQHPNLLRENGPEEGSFARKVWDELSDKEKEVLSETDPAEVEKFQSEAVEQFQFVYPADI